MKNANLAEVKGLKQAFAPKDLNGAATTGARISLKEGDRVAVVISLGTSTAAAVVATLRQHDAATSGNSKDLEVDNLYFHKAGAATKFTKVQPSAAAAAYTLSSIFAADGGIVVFEVEGSQLDINGGFNHFSVNLNDTTAAKLAAAVYVLNADGSPAYELDL
jgi:hypothetical protein